MIVLTYLLSLAFITLKQRDLMYFPGGESPETIRLDQGDGGAQILRVTPKDGLSIRGWYWPAPDDQAPIIVYFHGNAQATAYWLDKMQSYTKAGFGFALAEYRGYSGNAGSPSEQGLYNDAKGYIEHLINDLSISQDRIVLLGESLGGGVAVKMATEYPSIRALVLESTYTSAVDVARQTYWFFPVELVMADQFRSIDQLDNVKAPVLIVHGDEDALIPYGHAKKLFNAIRQNDKRLVTIEGGTHDDLYARGAAKYVVGFLKGLDYPEQQ